MLKTRNFLIPVLLLAFSMLTGCLHIIEEVTLSSKGSGTYQMVVDMSELKGMMDMMKGMGENMPGEESDSTIIGGEGDYTPPATEADENPMGNIGEEFSGVAGSLEGIPGISNVIAINDTAAYKFGYSFDFIDITALNRALKVIGKEKYDTKTEETFRYSGKNFERLGVGDLGGEIKKTLSESEEVDESQMDMMKMFFADMSYQQIYRFTDRKIKKSDNKLGELSDDDHTLTVTLKPFDEEQMKQKASVATKIKLN
ncbi:MAG: hypothetical protein ACK5FV_01035 [Bacteroidota bacterium]|jgi:hypothetical protein